MEFKKINRKPITIDFIENENGEYIPAFIYRRVRYRLDAFLRVHNSPWFDSNGYPDYIHGADCNYMNPLFIELDEAGETVNLYTVK